jgi:hypothetical protein
MASGDDGRREGTSVRLTAEIRYDATPEQVFEMLTDPVFQQRKCAGTGALSYDVDVVAEGEVVTVTSTRELPTDAIPEFVRSFVGSTLAVRQVERWSPAGADGTRVGSVSVEIAGAPVRFTGRVRMVAGNSPGGASTVQAIDGDLKASLPLIGGRIEKAVEPAIRSAIKAEQRTGTAWLAGREP